MKLTDKELLVIHPLDVALMERIKDVAFAVAAEMDLPLKVCEPKRSCHGAYGLCYRDEGRISIELRSKRLKEDGGEWHAHPHSKLMVLETVAHELAHLTLDGKGHGPAFKAMEQVMLLSVLRRWMALGTTNHLQA